MFSTFYTFNLLEGIFWIALGFVVVFFILYDMPKRYRFLASYTALTLFVFGISDFIENYVGGFIYSNQWLFLGKAICVLALASSIFWYLRVRLSELKATQKT